MTKRRQIRTVQDIQEDPRNANKGTDRGREMLARSLESHGAGRSILIDRKGRTIAGAKTLEQAKRLGLPIEVVRTNGERLVVVQRDDLDVETPEGRALAIADNRVGEIDLQWDPGVLRDFEADGLDLGQFFDRTEFALLTERQEPEKIQEASVDESKATALQRKWGTKAGQVWTASGKGGVHHLACGDSTNRDEVAKAVGDARPSWMWTDPPYGVQYVGKTRHALRIQNDGDVGLQGLLQASFSAADGVLEEGASIYVCHPARDISVVFGNAFIDAGWHLHQTLVWRKDTLVLGHSDYHFIHEPIIYGWKGKRGRWFGGRDKTSVIDCARPKASDLHPTTKPVELIAACLRNSSLPGDVGYEPFAGSGSTFVAAEQLGRVCCGLEIDPKYVAVVLERLSLLGLSPRLEK